MQARLAFAALLLVSNQIASLYVLRAQGGGTASAGMFANKITGRTNVVIVSACSLRADYLDVIGKTHDLTPNLDALARRGFTCLRAYSEGTWTRPSHIALFSSRHPREANASMTLADDVASLPELYQRAGYATGGFTGGGNIAAGFGFARGFDVYTENEASCQELSRRVDEGMSWVDGLNRSAFFMFLHGTDCHAPFRGLCPDPRSPYALLEHRLASTMQSGLEHIFDGRFYPGASMEEYAAITRNPNLSREYKDQYRPTTLEPGFYGHLRGHYAAAVRSTDSAIGHLLDALRDRGLLDSTIVVVVGDHGWDLGEHGYVTHAVHGYDSIAHVPVILAGPSIPQGRSTREMVGLKDVAPTLLARTGLDRAPTFLGNDLVGLMKQVPADKPRFAVTTLAGLHPWQQPSDAGYVVKVWLRAAQSELVVTLFPQARTELYDLESDPGESKDLRNEPDSAARFAEMVALWRELSPRFAPLSGAFHGATLNASTRDFLQRNGYFDGPVDALASPVVTGTGTSQPAARAR